MKGEGAGSGCSAGALFFLVRLAILWDYELLSWIDCIWRGNAVRASD